MTNRYAVCLLAAIFCCSGLSSARQLPKECFKGPGYWCKNLKSAVVCGAVQHCIATVWETQVSEVHNNAVSEKVIRLISEMKDIKDLINAEYLAARVLTTCHELTNPSAATLCEANTHGLEEYLLQVVQSNTSPTTLCRIMGLCDIEITGVAPQRTTTKEETTADVHVPHGTLLGAQKCTWGPSYWCSNFSTGRECKATHHCIERVWSQMEFSEDSDEICKICTDMVTQARDQLMSNETQEELKQVFEGSCKLIPIKIVAKECMKLADEFVPELVETLSSQMNPTAVCSVAGLCNNAKIDELLEGYNDHIKQLKGCEGCRKTVSALRNKYDHSSYDDFLVGLLRICRRLDSFSDSCSMLVFKYFENIRAMVARDLTPADVCHASGQCAMLYHEHDLYDAKKPVEEMPQGDVPCEFCEQLITHLRDMLVANTTELEFYKILQGLCKQTGNFKAECLHIADEYYGLIYKFLTQELKGQMICSFMGMCTNETQITEPIAPLLPKELEVKIVTLKPSLIGQDEANSYKSDMITHAPLNKPSVKIVGSEPLPQLPVERMFVQVPASKAACSFCQYFLHYLQVEISDQKSEERIQEAVQKACDRLPASVNGECKQFVTEYGPAVIALLVQEIDPSSVCPAIGLCPQTTEVRKVAINSEKSNCPLCLFAVEQLETMLKNNKTEASIRSALDNLCSHLSQKLRTECTDFVDTYANQLVEMLVADMNPQEICVYLKLCKDESPNPLKLDPIDKFHMRPELRGDWNNQRRSMLPKNMLEGYDVETNEIYDNTVNGRPMAPEASQKTICVICEFVMKEIDEQIKDKHNEDEIKKIVHNVCTHMPKSVRSDCDQFVDKYADLVISLLAQEMDPDQVCEELKMCAPTTLGVVREEILDCAICETVVVAVKKVVKNDHFDKNIVHIVEKSCGLLPAKYSTRCHTMMEIYGDSVIHLIEDFGTKQVCQKIGLCASYDAAVVKMYRGN